MDLTSSLQRQLESQQKQIAALSQKIELILAELGKSCHYEPEKYSLEDVETPDEEASEEASE